MLRNKALGVLLVGLAVLASFSIFTVDQREFAIKLQLGRIVRSDYAPGLYFKLPFVQNVRKYDSRVQNLDSEPQLYLTSEKKNLKVDSFVKWRIRDVERYYTATGGNMLIANDRLATLIQKRLKDEFGKRTVKQVVSGERSEIMDILTVLNPVAETRKAGESAAEDSSSLSAGEQAGQDLGIEIFDVRLKRIDLPEEVSTSVYQRMAAERKEVAKDLRSQGEKVARTIRAEADRTREVIVAEAGRDGQRIRGEGDGEAADISAKAYGQNTEFYTLYRSLTAYRDTFSERSDVLLLEPDSEFFRYFKNPNPRQ